MEWLDKAEKGRSMGSGINELLERMKDNPKNVRFDELVKVCDHFFGKSRQRGSSHRVYKTPWPGDPRVNIQNSQGRAKVYQVRQVLQAIEKLERGEHV